MRTKLRGDISHKDMVFAEIEGQSFFKEGDEVFTVPSETLGKKSARGSMAPNKVEKVFVEDDRAYIVVDETKKGFLDGLGVGEGRVLDIGSSHVGQERGDIVSPEEGILKAKLIYNKGLDWRGEFRKKREARIERTKANEQEADE